VAVAVLTALLEHLQLLAVLVVAGQSMLLLELLEHQDKVMLAVMVLIPILLLAAVVVGHLLLALTHLLSLAVMAVLVPHHQLRVLL
jgi:uncharacterized membrane-anchored protein YitT (DUF2179 family)